MLEAQGNEGFPTKLILDHPKKNETFDRELCWRTVLLCSIQSLILIVNNTLKASAPSLGFLIPTVGKGLESEITVGRMRAVQMVLVPPGV